MTTQITRHTIPLFMQQYRRRHNIAQYRTPHKENYIIQNPSVIELLYQQIPESTITVLLNYNGPEKLSDIWPP